MDDFTKLVNVLNQTKTTTSTDGEYVYSFDYTPYNIELDLTMDFEFIKNTFSQNPNVIDISQRGKYWFDHSYEAKGIINNYEYNPITGETEISFIGETFKDTTNYNILARFLRWILRR